MLDAKLSTALDKLGLHRRRYVLRHRASQDDDLEVGPHHLLNTQSRCNAVEFVQAQSLCAPRFGKRFERHVESDLVPESEAVRNCACHAVDAHGLALDTVVLDTDLEHLRGNAYHAHGWRREARHAGAARHRQPHFRRQLRPEAVELKGRRQAHHGPRDCRRRHDEVVVLGRSRGPGQPVSAGADPFKRAGPCQPCQRAGVDAARCRPRA